MDLEKDRVIEIDLDLTETNFDKNETTNTGKTFWTTDVKTSYLYFNSTYDISKSNASLVLMNITDGSVVQRNIEVEYSDFSYMLSEQEIERAGNWVGQIIVEKDGKALTSRSFKFSIKGALLDTAATALSEIENYQTFYKQLNDLNNEMTVYLKDATLSESERKEAESIRSTLFAEYEVNEEVRKQNELQRIGSYERIEEFENDYAVLATNKIKNGDMSKGTDSWASTGSAIKTVENGILKVTPTSNSYSGVNQPYTAKTGNTIYAKVKVLQNTGADKNINFQLQSSISNLKSVKSGVETTLSSIVKLSTTSTLYITKDASTDFFDFYLINALIIDLTETFGAGNEPTATQMDRLLTQFPNSWFDGTQNLFLARWALNELLRQDRDKVNVKQGEWITPTLLNGWTLPNSYYQSVQYRINTSGELELRGSAMNGTTNAVFQLPVGYRPKKFNFYATPTTLGTNTSTQIRTFYVDTNGLVTVYNSGEGSYVHFGLTKVSLD